MDIEGLETVTKENGRAVESRFVEQGKSPFRHIALTVGEEGRAVAEFREGKVNPGIQEGERVAMAVYDEALGNRMVRALAKLHMGIEEATNAYTACDSELISRGFIIGAASGGQPVWVNDWGNSFCIVSTTAEGGLPILMNDPVRLVYGLQGGKRLVVNADTVKAALQMLDSGQLSKVIGPTGETTINGAFLKEDVTFH